MGEGRCRQYDEHSCARGGYCNFLHLKPTPRFAKKFLSRPGEGGSRRRRRDRDRNRGDRSGYRQFPIRGTSEERRRCIRDWNQERDRRLKDLEKIESSRGDEHDENI